MESTMFNMDKVVEWLQIAGIKTTIEMTGGNCATIYCGEPDSDGYYPVSAGPGSFHYAGIDHSVGTVADFYIGSDKDADIVFAYDGGNDEVQIAGQIAKFYQDVMSA